jgi:Na+/H+ antiporter NhaA
VRQPGRDAVARRARVRRACAARRRGGRLGLPAPGGVPVSTHTRSVPFVGSTAWGRNLAAPVREFLATETGGAVVMLAATAAALVWANAAPASYESVWHTQLAVRVGGSGIALDLRHWVNQGLMTLFFLVVGLEAKRELDLGELRERRRIAIPAAAAGFGILVPVAIYEAFNAGGPGGHGWGAAMSTDTAFALGILALLTPRAAVRLRVFLLSFSVVDDLAALIVIATVYTSHVSTSALAVAIALFALLLALRYLPVARQPISIFVAIALWVALLESGIDPVISGLIIGLTIGAYPPPREALERATSLTRAFREQPTPELARTAQQSVASAISGNERLQYDLHPWTSYAVLPLFALANAGIHVTGHLLATAIGSPITLGILLGYTVGKPVGVYTGARLASLRVLRGPRPFLSGPALAAAGSCASVGFTVSLLISSIAFSGLRLSEAKLGALGTVIISPVLVWLSTQVIKRLPSATRARQIGRTADDIPDLAEDVDPSRDHIRGREDASVTLLEYGDFECPYCGQAEQVVRQLLMSLGDDVRYVWRHLPLNDVHHSAEQAAEASEAAAAQGRFWDMYDMLLSHQDALELRDLRRYAEELGLDVERFMDDLRSHRYADRVLQDVSSADESGVSGTPTFFVNGRRHYGVYDIDTLTEAVRSAKNRARSTAVAAA